MTIYEACDAQQPGTGFRCTREKGHIPHGYAGVFWADDADTKALAEVAGRLGYELGRKDAIDEFAAACAHRARLANRMPEPERSGVREGMIVAWIAAEKMARSLTSQPSGAASTPRTASTGHTDLPEDAKPPQEPCDDPECPVPLMHSHPEGLPGDGE